MATLASGLVAGKPRAEEGSADLSRLKQGTGEAVAAFEWRGADGAVQTLAGLGRPVVLNLWATWCVPCVAEMPALDALAEILGGAVAVVALSSDRGGAVAVQRFYGQRGIKHLAVALDPGGAAARALGARGIPTTVLIDGAGLERGRLEGAADWAGAGAVARIRALLVG